MARKMRSAAEVELNLASMLDMAFQLLAFFILTFKFPAPEAQILMNMPAPQPMIGQPSGAKAGEDDSLDPSKVKALKTLVITVDREFTAVNAEKFKIPGEVSRRLNELLSEQGTPYEQVLIQANPEMDYGQVMDVVSQCTVQKLPDGSNVRLSFVPLDVPAAKPPAPKE